MAAGGVQCELGTVLAEHDDAGGTEAEQGAAKDGDECIAVYGEEADDTESDDENPDDKKSDGGVAEQNYKSVKAFQTEYFYNNFYYKKITD